MVPPSSVICALIWVRSCTTEPEPVVPVSAPRSTLVLGEAGEAVGGALHVGQQRLRGERIAVRIVEIGHIALERHREVLLERRGTGERRGVQPASTWR